MSNSFQNATLLLSDGTKFKGLSAGKVGVTTGEICFNTGMTGYQEIFTDPSYYGQIMVMATSHVGNYGMHDAEIESESMKIAGLVCKKFSGVFSRTSAKESIFESFVRENMVGISDLDTRAIVRHIRDKGAMNAIISSGEMSDKEMEEELARTPSMEGLELASRVSTKSPYTINAEGASQFRVAVMDYGVKKNILRCLTSRGITVEVFPYDTPADTILNGGFDGIMLSNGPGDPSAMKEQIAEVSKLVNSGMNIFGICLGHQLISLSQGLETGKMFNGHRGINHPVKNLDSGKCEVTSQNHGFVVTNESVEKHSDIALTHQHLNDNTVAGIKLLNKPVFSVQYHPEASPGPHDSRYLFDQFVNNMSKK